MLRRSSFERIVRQMLPFENSSSRCKRRQKCKIFQDVWQSIDTPRVPDYFCTDHEVHDFLPILSFWRRIPEYLPVCLCQDIPWFMVRSSSDHHTVHLPRTRQGWQESWMAESNKMRSHKKVQEKHDHVGKYASWRLATTFFSWSVHVLGIQNRLHRTQKRASYIHTKDLMCFNQGFDASQ